MSHEDIKVIFAGAISHVISNIPQYTVNPGRDFIRSRGMRTDRLISFLVSCGPSGTRIELLDSSDLQIDSPSVSVFSQQRARLRPEALEVALHRFDSVLQVSTGPGFCFVAANDSTSTFFSRPSFTSPEYLASERHSVKGFYSMHLSTLYDLQKHIYPATLIQPIRYKNEFRAFYDMVDRFHTPPGARDVFIGDHGCCSHSKIAHVMEEERYDIANIGLHFFLKDIQSMLPPVMNHSIAYA